MTMIQDFSVRSLSEYIALKNQLGGEPGSSKEGLPVGTHKLLVPGRPGVCPGCGTVGNFWAKGCYFRWAVEGDREEAIQVPRYMCRLCRLVVSVLFAFLVPYRQFTAKAIAEGVQRYILAETTYRAVAGDLAGMDSDSQRPNHSQVWRWVDLFASRSATVLGVVLQRACVKADKEDRLDGVSSRRCPNQRKAHSHEKLRKLDLAARTLALADILMDCGGQVVQAVRTYFLAFVQNPLSILTGRGVRLITPQNLQHAIL